MRGSASCPSIQFHHQSPSVVPIPALDGYFGQQQHLGNLHHTQQAVPLRSRAMTEIRPFVVVVDDERLIADTLTLVLDKHGFDAVACYSAEDAVTIVKTFRPDFLVSDVVLNQGNNGIDLAITAQQLVPTCKVILISGNAATADLLDAASRGGY